MWGECMVRVALDEQLLIRHSLGVSLKHVEAGVVSQELPFRQTEDQLPQSAP